MKKLLLLLSIYIYSFAIVTIAPAEPSDTKNYELDLGASYNQTIGNTDTLTYKGRVKATKFDPNYVTFINLSYLYSEASSIKNKDEFFAHARFIYKLDDINALETFVQTEAYPFKAVELRSLLGFGDRLKFDLGDTKIFVGLGAYTSILKESNLSAVNENRLNSYISLNGVLENIEYTLIGYYQPNIVSFDDMHMISNLELGFKLNESLKLVFEVNANYDSKPASGKKNYDISQLYGIVYKFKN